MKTEKIRSLVIVCAALMLVSGSAMAAITGTAHDFSGKSWNPKGEFCVPCHAPHNAINALDGPIWDHATTTQTFQRTHWDTGVTETITLGHSSKLCMSCHDGLTAVDAFNGNAGTEFISGGAKIGTDLTDDHPIGVEYPTGGPYHPVTDPFGRGTIADVLEDGKVECATCHYAHGGQDGKFLKVSNVGSALCRLCHTF